MTNMDFRFAGISAAAETSPGPRWLPWPVAGNPGRPVWTLQAMRNGGISFSNSICTLQCGGGMSGVKSMGTKSAKEKTQNICYSA